MSTDDPDFREQYADRKEELLATEELRYLRLSLGGIIIALNLSAGIAVHLSKKALRKTADTAFVLGCAVAAIAIYMATITPLEAAAERLFIAVEKRLDPTNPVHIVGAIIGGIVAVYVGKRIYDWAAGPLMDIVDTIEAQAPVQTKLDEQHYSTNLGDELTNDSD